MTLSQLSSLLTAKAHDFNFWSFIPYILRKQHLKLSSTLFSESSFYHFYRENMVCFHSGNIISAQMFMLVLEISRRSGAIPAQYCTSICRTLQVLLVDVSVTMISKHYLFENFFSDSLFHLVLPCHHFTCDWLFLFLSHPHYCRSLCLILFCLLSIWTILVFIFLLVCTFFKTFQLLTFLLNNLNFGDLSWTLTNWKHLQTSGKVLFQLFIVFSFVYKEFLVLQSFCLFLEITEDIH